MNIAIGETAEELTFPFSEIRDIGHMVGAYIKSNTPNLTPDQFLETTNITRLVLDLAIYDLHLDQSGGDPHKAYDTYLSACQRVDDPNPPFSRGDTEMTFTNVGGIITNVIRWSAAQDGSHENPGSHLFEAERRAGVALGWLQQLDRLN